jgi:hypothetical protein
MPLTLIVKSTDNALKAQREAAADRVLASLGCQSPDPRLLCFLDDVEWQAFKAANGVANGGFSAHVKPIDPLWRIAPPYILDRIFVSSVQVVDDFIYLHGSTCATDVGLTMTLAHELQHFIQRTAHRTLWAANTLIPNLPKSVIEHLGLRWCDVPHEREARIVAKRIAEVLFGADAVRQHIDGRIAERVNEKDATDWECIRGLSTSPPFDLEQETTLFFPRLRDYKAHLQSALRHFQSTDPDFADVDLEALLAPGHLG